ncbi:MAG: alpha/beta hydrolase [Anaerolineales bacterium]|nr:alpha/beta hydrolase [Anaerolineales bacterium]MDW8161693.1 alpha/beta hydrolase [Anaerolineales bacterium]
MKVLARILLLFLGLLLVVFLVGPFLVPIPPLEGTQPPEALADPDSLFISVNGLKVHVKVQGEGEPVFILLHGFGASVYSWNAVMPGLAKYGRVIAFDRPAFGLTERPLSWEGRNPYSPEAQVELVIGLMDHFGAEKAILIGNSAGGTIAMQTALAHPERVAALILVDAAVYTGGGAPAWLRPLLATPQMRRLGPLLVRQIQTQGLELLRAAWHDPSRIPPETIALYQKPLKVENWDKALWELTLASRQSDLPTRLSEFQMPCLVITGDDDRIVPTAESVRLAQELPNARLAVIENAGHVPHEEKPQEFLQAVEEFLMAQGLDAQ